MSGWKRLLATASLELRAIVTGPLFWVLLALVCFGTMSIGTDAFIRGDRSPGSPIPTINSQFAMAQVFCLTGAIFYGFFASIIAGRSVLRDDEHRISEILHSSPLRTTEYVMGKFLGAIGALVLAIGVQTAFAMLFYQLSPIADPELMRGPFDALSFIVPALALTAPCAFVYAGIAFAVGARTRRPVLVFAVPITLFVLSTTFLWSWSPAWMGPRLDRLLMILEPSGLRWLIGTFFEPSRGVDFYNLERLTFDATFWSARAAAILGPLLAVAAVIPYCRAHRLNTAPARTVPRMLRRLLDRHRSAGLDAHPAEDPAPTRAKALPVGDLAMTIRRPGWLAETLRLAAEEIHDLIRQPALYVFVLLTISMIFESAGASGAFGAPLVISAGTLATRSLDLLTLILFLALLAYTVESIARERTTRFDALLFSTPARTSAILVAKSIANAAVVGIVLAAAIGTGATVLALQSLILESAGRFEVAPMVLVWGVILLPTFFFWSAFVTAVLALSGNRYLTYGIGLATLIGTFVLRLVGKMTWLTNWPLWGTLRWSDMGAFALDGRALLLNRLLMTGLGGLFLMIAIQGYERVSRDPARRARRHRPSRLLRRAAVLSPLAIPTLVVGVVLASALENGFQSDAAKRRAKDYWRQNVATWRDHIPATIVHVALDIDLAPASRSMVVEGSYTMRNDTDQTKDRLLFSVGPFFEAVTWSLDGTPIEAEDRAGLNVLDLAARGPNVPLAPGQSVRVGFSYRAEVPHGITRNGGGVEQFILPSGIVLHNLRDAFIPTPGYLPGRGIDEGNVHDPAVLALGERRRLESARPPVSRYSTRIAVTAPSDYTINAVGAKVDEREHDGRTTAVWVSDHPVSAINIVGGRWDSVTADDTAVFFHPAHARNAQAILETLVAARVHYSDWFAPYPWRELRLNEFPDLVSNAQGFPTNISFSEGIGFMNRIDEDPEGGVDLAFLVTAHEAAHQWWGNLVSAAEGPGTAHLIEGMAHYSALRLRGAVSGPHARMALARHMESNYLRERDVDTELPLAAMVDDQSPEDWTVVYEKGAWAMWMLERHLGSEAMLEGLRNFISAHRARGTRPFLEDLLASLEPFAADAVAYRDFVEQWFHQVVVPEVAMRGVTATETDGRYTITATVENIGGGTVDLTLAATAGARFTSDGAIRNGYRESRTSVRLRPGVPRTVTWTADFAPATVLADPDVDLLQRHRDRAIVEL